MRRWTEAQHQIILHKHPLNKDAAQAYGSGVSPQNVAYWRTIFQVNEGNMAAADRAIKEERKLRVPQPDDDIGVVPDLAAVYHCVLHIPDQHYPYQHPDILGFLGAVKAAFPIDLVVNAGDETDYHGLSFHDSDPNLDSAGVELEKAKVGLAALHELFPRQLVCNSNHGSMAFRKAKHHGIPVQLLRKYRDVLFPQHGAPGWSWAERWIVNTPLGQVQFQHQSGNPVLEAAHNRCNLLVGHNHSKFEIAYSKGQFLYWGGTGGCLIDEDSYAFAYGKNFPKKPIIGCTVILEGRPMLIPMILKPNGRWIGHL